MNEIKMWPNDINLPVRMGVFSLFVVIGGILTIVQGKLSRMSCLQSSNLMCYDSKPLMSSDLQIYR